ncbi:MAG: 50S ribosomal protein L15 [Candidatus Marinimicrobia bacterium]|nr:50S ribosomal protein L15 [Candidatus Neomarinimicrobiota bacterium]
MDLSNLTPAPGSTKKSKRKGRGVGTGNGKTAGRGAKGAHSRTGSKHYAWFEGGQMPLQRRVPKRGFSNDRFRQEFQIVNVSALEIIEEETINADILVHYGLIKKAASPVKILGNGELKKKYEVSAEAFSQSAREKIEKAGGKVIVL